MGYLQEQRLRKFSNAELIFSNIEITVTKFTSEVHRNTSFRSSSLFKLQFLSISLFLQNLQTLILDSPLLAGCFILSLPRFAHMSFPAPLKIPYP